MRKSQSRKDHKRQLERELSAVLMAISGTMHRIAGNIQILCAERQMKGVKRYDNR